MRKLLFALVLSLAFAGCNGNGNDIGGPDPDPAPPAGDTDCLDLTDGDSATIELQDFVFEPECAIVTTEQGLSIPNAGDVLHSFTLEGTEVDLDVAVGEETNTEAIGGIVEPGTYVLFCKYHRGGGMEGELQVESA